MNFKTKIYALLSGFWALFIFSNSFKGSVASNGMSDPVAGTAFGWLENLGLNLDIDLVKLIIRKGAHFSEFCLLGILITLCFIAIGKKISYYTGTILFICLSVGVTDEFIQSFIVGRSSEVRDVLIDFSGALLGYFIIVLVFRLMQKKKYRYKFKR